MKSKRWTFVFPDEFYWIYRVYDEELTEKEARSAMRQERGIKRLPKDTQVEPTEDPWAKKDYTWLHEDMKRDPFLYTTA